MRFLVDTNVILDVILKRDEACKDACRFFIWCKQQANEIYISSMTLRDIEYIVRKSLHDKNKANHILSKVYVLCTKIVGVSADSAITAIYEDYKDYKDELQIQTAKEEMCDAVITNNIKDFAYRGINVFTPKEIVNYSKGIQT